LYHKEAPAERRQKPGNDLISIRSVQKPHGGK
jgi:hypothetical protein